MDLVKRQMNAKSPSTPDQRNPFVDRTEQENDLWVELRAKQEAQEIPSGYGLISNEEGYSTYEVVEPLPLGSRKLNKYLHISLPEQVWLPRIILWVQAIEALYHILNDN